MKEENNSEGEDVSFSDLINDEAKQGSALADLEATMEENVTIPGLPEDD